VGGRQGGGAGWRRHSEARKVGDWIRGGKNKKGEKKKRRGKKEKKEKEKERKRRRKGKRKI